MNKFKIFNYFSLFNLLAKKRTKIINSLNENEPNKNENETSNKQETDQQAISNPASNGQDLV